MPAPPGKVVSTVETPAGVILFILAGIPVDTTYRLSLESIPKASGCWSPVANVVETPAGVILVILLPPTLLEFEV